MAGLKPQLALGDQGGLDALPCALVNPEDAGILPVVVGDRRASAVDFRADQPVAADLLKGHSVHASKELIGEIVDAAHLGHLGHPIGSTSSASSINAPICCSTSFI